MKLLEIRKRHTELPTDLKTDIARRSVSLSKQRMLYHCVHENGFENVIEIGTFKGCTSLYLAAACEEQGGTLYTINIRGDELSIARDVAGKCGIRNIEFILGDSTGPIRSGAPTSPISRCAEASFTWSLELLPSLVERIGYQFVFIDGKHNYKYAFGEYELTQKHLARPGAIVFDDASYVHSDSQQDGGVPRAYKEAGAILYPEWDIAMRAFDCELQPLHE